MLQIDLTAQVRETFGKGAARSLRRSGSTPAVLYGPNIEPIALELETKAFTKAMLTAHRKNAMVNLEIRNGKTAGKRHVIVKELKTDPVRDELIHADFYEISLEAPITLPVPLRYTGKAKGVEMGGDLSVTKEQVLLKGKILDIPDFIEVDLSPLGLGDVIKCGDLSIPGHLSLEENAETVCVSVTAPAGAAV